MHRFGRLSEDWQMLKLTLNHLLMSRQNSNDDSQR